MAKEICISTTPHETRLAITEDDNVVEVHYERENEYTLAGSIYKGRVTRVLPGMQSSFVDVGLERDAFLYVTDFLEEQEDSEDYVSENNGRREGGRGQRPVGGEEPRAAAPERAASERGNQERGSERGQERGGEQGGDRNRRPLEGARDAVREGGREQGRRAREQAVAPLREAVPAEQDLEEKGDDEAPAGTRRWRGRRGRRRGVRASLPQSQNLLGDSPEALEEASTAEETMAAPFAFAERGAPGGIASLHASPEVQEEEVIAPPARSGRNQERGGERGRDRGNRGPREPYARASTFDRPVERASERSGERAAERPLRESGPRTEVAIVLPGESISKYGSVPADANTPVAAAATAAKPAARPVNYVAPKPSTLVELSGDWDGGSVLPGETISRYRGEAAKPAQTTSLSSASAEPAVELFPEPEVETGSTHEVTPAEGSGERLVPAEAGLDQVEAESGPSYYQEENTHEQEGQLELQAGAPQLEIEPVAEHQSEPAHEIAPLAEPEMVAAAVSPAAEGGEAHVPQPEIAASGELVRSAEAPQDAELAPAEESEALQAGSVEAQSESSAPASVENQAEAAEAEYEPGNSSASYRVTPPGSSELRMPSPEVSGEDEPSGAFEDAAPAREPIAEAAHDSMHEAVSGREIEHAPEQDLEHGHHAHEDHERHDLEILARGEVTEFSGELPPEHALQHEIEPPHEQPETHTGAPLTILHEDGTIEEAPGISSHEPHPSPESYADAAATAREETHAEPFERHGIEFGERQPRLSPAAEAQQADAENAAMASRRPNQASDFAQMVDQLQGFAPGNGLLEEEVIDEDEYDFEPMHAHMDEHDQEDLEEETLDQNIDPSTIGDAVRDSYLAQRLQQPEEAISDFGSRDEFVVEQEEAAFGYEEVDEDEEEGDEVAASAQTGEPQRGGRGGREGSEGRGRGRTGGRNGGRRNGGPGRGRSAQTQDLPIITDLLKQGQEILVQIAKEPIAKKGARITSHIALPGRFLVFMPTVNHVGVSRKISSDEERQRLKRILISEKGDQQGGFIVRTAAENANEEDLRADLRFLISLWTEIKQRSEAAKAPALIYHDLNLIERILRDQVSSNFATIWVDSEAEYERIIRFLNRFQPALVRRVKLYTKETPLFEHFGIQEEISKALKSKVWLKSGGSIVINQTEALVAIDINTGKYVGKTARLEDTIVKTNLDAIPEIVRQIRLRDLGGIIVIDFIDMDERKNRNRVLAALEEELKHDRAPSKVLQFNDFGLVAITRKRVKQSLERTLSVQCETCSGTGMVKSPITVCNEIYIEMRKMMKHLDGKDVMLRVNPEVVKQLKAGNGKWINELEEMIAKTIIIKSDPSLHPEQFDIH